MDLSTVTVQDFKDEFTRSFAYLSSVYWLSTTNYFSGNEVYQLSNTTFYQSLTTNLNSTPDTNPTDWSIFEDYEKNYILDSDIEKAFKEAQKVINQAIFPDDPALELAYLYLTAHFLSGDLKAASQSINSSAPTTVSSKSVGSVSESYSIPSEWTEDANLAFFTTSYYGVKYLAFVMPYIKGNVQAVLGATTP